MISHPSFRVATCNHCGSAQVSRRPRTVAERFRFRLMYKCKECGKRSGIRYWELWPWFSLKAQCPKCGNPEVKTLKRRDGIDPVSNFVISRVQQLLGAPIFYCQYCRLQFYDYRSKAHTAKTAAS